MTIDLTASGANDVFPSAGDDAGPRVDRDVEARHGTSPLSAGSSSDGPTTGADVMPEYVLTRKRMKHLRMTVKVPHGTVHVSAPMHAKQRDIDAFVMGRRDWIRKQQLVAMKLPAPLTAGPEAEQLRREMRDSVPPLMAYWAQRMDLEMPSLTLRRMTSRWGSCNSVKRHVTLNLELGRRDPELLEYVIVHELAHLYEPNHSKRFYAVMDKYLPDWKAKRRELNHR